MKYQIIAGSHFENGKLYRKGEIIDSPHPLDKMFPHKIRRVVPKEKESPPSKKLQQK